MVANDWITSWAAETPERNLLEVHLEEVVKPTWNYAGRILDETGHWCNAALGLAGETGETVDLVKKIRFHTPKPFNTAYREKLLSEVGDVLYYWLRLISFAGFSVEEVLAYNRKKLESRHPELGKVTERFGAGMIR